MVNAVNARVLADFIERHTEYKFDMGSPMNVDPMQNECGSAGCIGGFAAALWPDDVGGYTATWHDDVLAEKLGITMHQHEMLCYPVLSGSGHILSDVRRETAVEVLRHLADTGHVGWKEIMRKKEEAA